MANAVSYIWCTKQEKDPYAICVVQSNLGILHSSTYTTVSTDSESKQLLPRSTYTYAQADQGLHCQQIT